jgi:ATP-dependent helicase Lhr and Lhr-like helicase
MSLELFHPATAARFRKIFAAPTEAQAAAWSVIRAGRPTLIAASRVLITPLELLLV